MAQSANKALLSLCCGSLQAHTTCRKRGLEGSRKRKCARFWAFERVCVEKWSSPHPNRALRPRKRRAASTMQPRVMLVGRMWRLRISVQHRHTPLMS